MKMGSKSAGLYLCSNSRAMMKSEMIGDRVLSPITGHSCDMIDTVDCRIHRLVVFIRSKCMMGNRLRWRWQTTERLAALTLSSTFHDHIDILTELPSVSKHALPYDILGFMALSPDQAMARLGTVPDFSQSETYSSGERNKLAGNNSLARSKAQPDVDVSALTRLPNCPFLMQLVLACCQ